MKKNTYIIAVTFLWLGFVGAISFMEAWLKFQAPGITTELGLGIGKLVFSALNKVEIICAILILFLYYSAQKHRKQRLQIFLIVPVIILFIQSVWMLPQLNTRADLVIQNVKIPKSNLHIYYIIVEIIKVICLSIFGIKKQIP